MAVTYPERGLSPSTKDQKVRDDVYRLIHSPPQLQVHMDVFCCLRPGGHITCDQQKFVSVSHQAVGLRRNCVSLHETHAWANTHFLFCMSLQDLLFLMGS